MSGCHIAMGHFQEQDLARLTVLKLALTSGERAKDDWQEYLLIARDASPAQVAALLELLRRDLLPGFERSSDLLLPMYQAPLDYEKKEDGRAQLHLRFSQAELLTVANGPAAPQREWTYQRHVALQTSFDTGN
jgi:hypothetical protein